MNYHFILSLIALMMAGTAAHTQPISDDFVWPEGKQMALSLSFDDARLSQPDTGIPFLNQYDVKATFYVVPSAVEQRLEGWKQAVESGH
jgi:peptidoglycan/xylan/chitin deacetylase (PgdA/CDA1 family)